MARAQEAGRRTWVPAGGPGGRGVASPPPGRDLHVCAAAAGFLLLCAAGRRGPGRAGEVAGARTRAPPHPDATSGSAAAPRRLPLRGPPARPAAPSAGSGWGAPRSASRVVSAFTTRSP